MALAGLERYKEALTEYFQCYLLEDSCSKFLKMEIVKVLQLLITDKMSPAVTVTWIWRWSPYLRHPPDSLP